MHKSKKFRIEVMAMSSSKYVILRQVLYKAYAPKDIFLTAHNSNDHAKNEVSIKISWHITSVYNSFHIMLDNSRVEVAIFIEHLCKSHFFAY